MSNKYDAIIIGAGAGGLAMALFMAQNGRKTLIIEKAGEPGGALGSFETDGYRLDAGFHFAGALQNGGIFDEILKLAGIRDAVEPIFLNPDQANIFHFRTSGEKIDFPYGIDNLKESLKRQFPTEKKAVDQYFTDIEKIVAGTPTLKMETIHLTPGILPEDSITFQSYLATITENTLLRETLNALVMCHGSAPSEISLADNARLCYGFYESIAVLKDGGASLVNAFLDKLKEYDVDIITSEEVTALGEIQNKKTKGVITASGRELNSDTIIFTINPKTIAKILPETAFPPAFFHRIEQFECTPGFFTVFAALDPSVSPEAPLSITSLYPVDDIDALSLPDWKGPGALAIIHSESDGKQIVTAFEPLYWKSVAKWQDSEIGKRPEDYYRWKKDKSEEILKRITEHFPSYKGKIKLITSATPLTYRDYLNHYNGAAYGIKQKINQFNLIGQLRIKNIFVAGQSAILPGVLGTIMASLLVTKNIIGTDAFKIYIDSAYSKES